MPTLLRTLPRSQRTVVAGTDARSFFLREEKAFVEYDLDGAPTGHAFDAPSLHFVAASHRGERLAFATDSEILVLDRRGDERWRAPIETSGEGESAVSFDRSGKTIALFAGAPGEQTLTLLEVGTSRSATLSVEDAEQPWLLPDWSVDGVMLFVAYYEQTEPRAAALELGEELESRWSRTLVEEDVREPVPLHYSDGKLIALASEHLVVFRGEEPAHLTAARGAESTFCGETSSPDRIALWERDALRIHDAGSLAERASIPCRDDGGHRFPVLLADDRVLILKDPRHLPLQKQRLGGPSLAELWSIAR
jgi:hypothetical protein